MTDEDEPAPDTARTDDESTGTYVGRRRLLRTGVNVGFSGALVWGFGRNYASRGRYETITYAMARPEPGASSVEPRTKEVPAEWYESLRLAFKVQREILKTSLAPLLGSFIIPGTHANPGASLTIDATDESVVEQIDDLARGVSVDVTVMDAVPPKPEIASDLTNPYQVLDLDADSIPGGVVCLSEKMFGTLTPALYDAESGKRFFATSNHVFGEGGTKKTEHRGEPLQIKHGDENHRVGDVDRGYPVADIVRVAPVGEFRPASEIERASPRRVIGQYTKWGLADLMAQEEKVTKLGAMSGRTTGAILGIDGVTCYTGEACKPGQLKWGNETSIVDGDSGSVSFHQDPENPDEYVLVTNINNARSWWPGAEFAWGTAAHHLLQEYGLHF